MKNKIIITIIICMATGLCLSGCKLVPSLDLTEDEQKVIAEYAAGLLLKYDRNYEGALSGVDEEEQEDGLPVVEEVSQNVQPQAEQPQLPEPEFSEDLTSEVPNVDQNTDYSTESLASSIGLNDFEIFYKSYESHNIYPEAESADQVFSMQAQAGMELLVVNFTITNDTDSRKLCDVLSADPSFRLIINGNERVNADKTILLNDLSSYCEEIDGYGMVDAVLVFEVSEGTTAGIETLDLVVKNSDVYATHKLR